MPQESSLYTDAELYDLVHPDLWKGELAFYLRQVERCPAAAPQVLELACGSGRLTLPLARRGVNICGLDLSETMLAQARRKAQQAGLEVPFWLGDMRAFALDRQFDLIFIPINSVCHLLSLEDFERCLTCVRAHLAPGGRFLIDVFVPDAKLLSRPRDRWYDLGEYTDETGRKFHLSEQIRYDPAAQINAITWRFESEAGRVEHSLQMRMYFPQELAALLAYNGLPLVERYGKYNEEPFHSGSARQVCICEMRP